MTSEQETTTETPAEAPPEPEKATATKGAAMIPLDRAPFTFKTLTAVADTDFVPKALRGKPNSILASILTGRELGLGPMESLRSIDVIDGRPSPSAEWMVGRVFDAGHIIEVVEQTDKTCTVKGTRMSNGTAVATMTFTFTIEMAARAVDRNNKPLTSKANWKNYPEAMLYWRAVAQLCRQFFPDAIRGLRHSPEELGSTDSPFGPVTEDQEPDYPEPAAERIVDAETGEILDPDDEEATADAGPTAAESPADADYAPVWPPEPTGAGDEAAIARVVAHADEEDLWGEVFGLLGSHEWTEDTMEVIESNVRFLCRAMEYLEVWESENSLREFLARTNNKHISELKRAELVTFARNVVMRAMTATRSEDGHGE